ncbi:hypothetical protein SI859A1_00680 [Aurantimonas manganoxydans SI85-9A1]|uniref:Uncharacterized protein n=1 Tax=Aurantimonas manganoxydans (strain ATCC BAA-1229 / DSM 21871 / SI85-9A1) TaxID=287752 RepID=Q1YKG3_AURMS|nr:hypothetical protein SI859A1_00680 [Aurantimonas manganoxydans SI85-9A1]
MASAAHNAVRAGLGGIEVGLRDIRHHEVGNPDEGLVRVAAKRQDAAEDVPAILDVDDVDAAHANKRRDLLDGPEQEIVHVERRGGLDRLFDTEGSDAAFGLVAGQRDDLVRRAVGEAFAEFRFEQGDPCGMFRRPVARLARRVEIVEVGERDPGRIAVCCGRSRGRCGQEAGDKADGEFAWKSGHSWFLRPFAHPPVSRPCSIGLAMSGTQTKGRQAIAISRWISYPPRVYAPAQPSLLQVQCKIA